MARSSSQSRLRSWQSVYSNACPRFVPAMATPSGNTTGARKTTPRQNVSNARASKVRSPEQQRQAFLHKVRQQGSDRKWETRGEQVRISLNTLKSFDYPLTEESWQMLREDFLAFERLWVQQQDQSAPTLPASHEDIDLDQSPQTVEGQGNT